MAALTFENVSKVYPDQTRAVNDLCVEIPDGEFVVFVGPSGCGKTTALRMIAGLEDVTDGQIRIDGEVINEVEPRKRDVAMVFQNYALYPHMTVFENIAFPLRAQRMAKDEMTQRVTRAAKLLGLTEQLKRRPRHLSGGQRQRVAMGRAIVREPTAFLMDEPLSNLDAKLRVQMRAEVAQLQQELGVTTVYVTHDQVEAMTMGSRIVVMRKGVLQQVDAPQRLYEQPVNLFVATFIGSPAMNLFCGTLDRPNGTLLCRVGDQTLSLDGSAVDKSPNLNGHVGTEVAVGVRPEHVGDPTSADPSWPRLKGRVALVERLGSETLVHLELDAKPVATDEVLEVASDTDAAIAGLLQEEAEAGQATVVARFGTHAPIARGDEIEIAVDLEHLHFFDLGSGSAIS